LPQATDARDAFLTAESAPAYCEFSGRPPPYLRNFLAAGIDRF
jgi:hypothetical protein